LTVTEFGIHVINIDTRRWAEVKDLKDVSLEIGRIQRTLAEVVRWFYC
jgi:hypothetical protein